MKIQKIWDFNREEQFLGLEIGTLKINTKQILTFTKSGKIMVFSIDGELLLEEEISPNIPLWNVKISDIDNDGNNEIIIAGLDGLLRVFKNKKFSLKPLWAHQFGASISGFIYADVNNDSVEEILAYSIDKSLRCLNSADGSLIWGQLFGDGIGDVTLYKDPLDPLTLEIIACY